MTEGSAPGGGAPAPPAAPTSAPPAAPAAPSTTAAAAAPAPQPEAGGEPGAPPKTKTRFPYQRACNEKDAKGKLCAGHLKRWYGFGEEIKKQFGPDAEIYRCEHCHTIYLPAPGYRARSGTMQF